MKRSYAAFVAAIVSYAYAAHSSNLFFAWLNGFVAGVFIMVGIALRIVERER